MNKCNLLICVVLMLALGSCSRNKSLFLNPDEVSIQGIGLGDSGERVNSIFGKPPRHYGSHEIGEITYLYDGLDITVVEGKVELIVVTSAEYPLANGIRVGQNVIEVAKIAGIQKIEDDMTITIGEGSDCWVSFRVNDHKVVKIRQHCSS